jgi:hypothetical protein
MAYRKWTIGGITPTWVEPDFEDDRDNKTLKLKCAAIYDETNQDPIEEIDAFDALASDKIHNDGLLNGGTKLQVQGQIITVTATNEDETETRTWNRCSLKRIVVALDSYYDEDVEGSVIEYELVITYQTQGDPGGIVYYPDYQEHDNIEFYMTTDKSDPGVAVYGEELGWMQITETQNVQRVETLASACVGNDTYPATLNINGEIFPFHCSHDENFACNTLPHDFEIVTCELDTPTNVITIQSANHVNPFDTCDNNRGAWLKWVRLIFASE